MLFYFVPSRFGVALSFGVGAMYRKTVILSEAAQRHSRRTSHSRAPSLLKERRAPISSRRGGRFARLYAACALLLKAHGADLREVLRLALLAQEDKGL